jgi:hypothetical protein
VTKKTENLKPWKAWESGNPAGRKPGTSAAAKLRIAIEKDLPEIIVKLVEQAKAGDAGSARLLLERVLPPIRAAEQPVPIEIPVGTLTDQGRAVVAAAGAGVLAPGQASQLVAGLGSLAKLVETDELAARIAALEERSNAKP